jgi:Flp pilus assembly protein TadD
MIERGGPGCLAVLLGAYAVRRCRSLPEALEFLNRGAELLQEDPTFWFNRACYVCQLGDVEAAKIAFSHAFKLNPALRVVALEEEDLEPLWDTFSSRGR